MSPVSNTPTPSGDDEERSTPTGERIPSQDFLVGEMSFGITEQDILDAATARPEDAELLQQNGKEAILARIQKLYDAIVEFERQGLRGKALFLKVANDPELLETSKKYYGFLRGPVWGARQQSVWIANW